MNQPTNQITLIDGKSVTRPTDARSAVRIRLSDKANQLGKPAEGEIQVGLQVTPEPKLTMHQLVSVRVDKALDDQGQNLSQLANAGPKANPGPPAVGFGGANFGGGFGGGALGVGGFQGGMLGAVGAFGFGMGFQGVGQTNFETVVQLKKGAKAAKAIQELTGVITALVTVPTPPLIEVDNILKAVGKTVKGKQGGHIKVTGVTTQQANGTVTVRFELDAPAGNQGNVQGGQAIPIVPPARVAPLVPPAPPRKQPGQGQGQGQAGQGVAQPGQVQGRPAQIQVQIQPAPLPFNPVQIGFGGFNGLNGIQLLDAKGNAFQSRAFGQVVRQIGGKVVMEHQLTFQVPKGQTPAKLVYRVPRQANIEIPFTLKGIPIP